MRVLVANDNPLTRAGGRFYSVFSWPRFPERLAESGVAVTLLSPVVEAGPGAPPPAESWELRTGRLAVASHDPFTSFYDYFRKSLSRLLDRRRLAMRLMREHDILALRVPSPMLGNLARAALDARKPFVLIVAGDMATQSEWINSSTGLKKVLLRAFARFFQAREVSFGRRADLVYAYSEALVDRHRSGLRPVKLIRTPHVSRADFSSREDTCLSSRIRLLRVCWLMRNKGLETLLRAAARLKGAGFPFQLTLVGQEAAPGFEASLRAMAADLGIGPSVTFAGWVPFDQVNRFYDSSDIQVISSSAEGTPRCIVEGAARGLPLVCTRAGGSAFTLADGESALLVEPDDEEALAAAVRRVAEDGALRRRLIRGGYALAEASSFETLGKEIATDLAEIVRSRAESRSPAP